ncbi:hypothetical protein L917_18284 [Phytophthora nicotianae]|uniref:Integrase catalytic domain-containing protein n=1 Tax=Phytophthora nicotianae TaxID=4792 RepID=W2K838_PHYNI|nr:hypothetical protein L917_18284 [Phytophthora nicotianae]
MRCVNTAWSTALLTNAYSPEENGIVERANGIVLPRVRAMLAATRLPHILWGEALLHAVTTLNWLPTKPMGLVTPLQKLFQSRQRKEKLEPREKLSLLLGYTIGTPGYKFLDLQTGQVVTVRGQNVRFHEEFTADGTYVRQLLENAFLDGDHQLPETVPVARIKTTMETNVPEQDEASPDTKQLLEVRPEAEVYLETTQCSSGNLQSDSLSTGESSDSQRGVAAPAAVTAEVTSLETTKAKKKRRKRRARKKVGVEKEPSGFEVLPPSVEPCPKRPRRVQRRNVRLSDYVVGNVMATMDVPIPMTYKQARASKFWPQWKSAMLAPIAEGSRDLEARAAHSGQEHEGDLLSLKFCSQA